MELASIDVPSGKLKAVLASPRHEGARPAVILIHEVFGLNTDMREKAQRFADMGYVALAPDLYSTRGPMPLCVVRTVRGLGGGEGPVFADLEACRAWLAARPKWTPAYRCRGLLPGGGIALLFAVRADLARRRFYGAVPSSRPNSTAPVPCSAVSAGETACSGKNGKLLAHHLQDCRCKTTSSPIPLPATAT